ncbi:MAG: hypothetical protein ACXQTS_04265 [Candidatus Methanospirareceae archaeon]
MEKEVLRVLWKTSLRYHKLKDAGRIEEKKMEKIKRAKELME